MATSAKRKRAPSRKCSGQSAPLWLAITDVPRAFLDFGLLCASSPFLLFAPRGDGHPVMLLPGFGATDLSLELLSRYLKYLGYDVHSWELGQNMGTRTLGVRQAKLTDRLEQIHAATGRKVSLLGWSLGGTFARQLSQSRPDLVRQVIMLGSPLYGAMRNSAAPAPVTSIFSKSDGVVPWRFSQVAKSRSSENIEVQGAHVGLGFNPAVFWATADRLALPEGRWTVFQPRSFASFLYPSTGK